MTTNPVYSLRRLTYRNDQTELGLGLVDVEEVR